MAVATKLGDVVGASNAGIVEDDAVDGAKLGEAYDGVDMAATFRDADGYVDVVMYGDIDRRSYDANLFGIVGRKLGDVANESVRFDGAVAKSAVKSGELEPVVVMVASSGAILGHTASAPSSTWS
jgi:hypothetical protein